MKLITFREFREKLGGRSRSTIYADLEAKRLPPPIKIGSKLYWSEAAVDEHIREMVAQAAEGDAA